MKKMPLLLAALFLVSLAAAGTPEITAALCGLYDFLKGALPVFGAVLIIFAAVIYAAGQMMGAEMRARANVWAMSMLVGALIGFAVAIIVPWFLDMLWTEQSLSTVCGG